MNIFRDPFQNSKKDFKKTVLVILWSSSREQVLMIHKKQGQGAGKWNFPGGKVKERESLEEAARRETEEETGLVPLQLTALGVLDFIFPKSNSWDNQCVVFLGEGFSGSLRPECQECTAEWVECREIPYEKMWDTDRLWLPLVFDKKKFHRSYWFNEKDQMIREEIIK